MTLTVLTILSICFDSYFFRRVGHDPKPMGTFLLRNLILLSNRELSTLKISEVQLLGAMTVAKNEPGLRLAALFTEKNIPVIAAADEQGKTDRNYF
ncbi:MAG: hypothetical protein ACHQ1H_07670 [Nitrososphaerales archaeon]